MRDATWLTNHLLIAMPSLRDPNFARAVTFLCQHNREGAMGLMVNRISEYRLGDVLSHMQIQTDRAAIAAQPVLLGGPVQPERGFVLHEPCGIWDSTFQVSERICVTTSRDILAAIAEGKGPRQSLVALGYAGWSAGQIEQEMLDNAWLTVGASTEILFDTPLEQRWDAAAALVGVKLDTLADYAGHA